MPQVIFSPAAIGDLQRLHDFLKSRNPQAARRAIATIRKSLRTLATHPHIGRPVEGMDPAFREWLIRFGRGGYVARYYLDEDDDIAIVMAIRHMREAGY